MDSLVAATLSWQELQTQRPRLLCQTTWHFLALQQCYCAPAPLRGALALRCSSQIFTRLLSVSLLYGLVRLFTTTYSQHQPNVCFLQAIMDGSLTCSQLVESYIQVRVISMVPVALLESTGDK